MFDAELYRDKAEVEEWKQRDPIRLLRRRLEGECVLDEGALAALESDVQEEVTRAAAFAEAGTWEPVEQLTRDVYTRQEVMDAASAG
jgi:pyruvate dehydrogenase E1 component alpha subunit